MKPGRFYSVILGLALAPCFAGEPTRPPKPPADGNRFLFVVATSQSMERFDHSGRQAVFDLIYTGIDSQMRAGDTYGVWTFSDQTRAGVFPIQVWNPKATLQLASRVGVFLEAQKYGKGARLDRVMVKLLPLIRSVKDVNVLIISDGESRLKGTPFDDRINSTAQKIGFNARRAKKPLVTTLVASNGKIISGSVVIAGEPVKLPGLVALAQTAPKADVKPPVQPVTPPAPKVITFLKQPVPISAAPKTDATAPVAGPAEPAAAIAASVAGEQHQSPATQINPATSATAVAADSSSPTTRTASPSPSKDPVDGQTETGKSSESATLAASTPVTVKALPGDHQNAQSAGTPPGAGNESERGVRATPPLPAFVPVPTTVAAREPVAAADQAAPDLPSALAAVAAPSLLSISPRGMLLVGAVLLLAGLGLLALIIRCTRVPTQPSIISRSLERGGD